jgi:hypothetical protein
MGQGDWKHQEPAEPPKRSLILEVAAEPRAPAAKVAPFSLGYFFHKRKTALMIVGGVVIVVVPVLLALRPEAEPSALKQGAGAAVNVDCLEVEAAYLAVQNAAVAQTVAPIVRLGSFSDSLTRVQVMDDCTVVVMGSNSVRQADGSVSEDIYGGRAVPDWETSTYRVAEVQFAGAGD